MCDSQFAYEYPETFKYSISGDSTDIALFNRSTHNGYMYPTIKISNIIGNNLEIANHSNGDRVFTITDMPTGIEIYIDCERQIITTNELSLGKDSATNIYKLCNYKFPRLVPGENELTFNGDCDIEITCEFLRKVGS